MAFRTVVVDHSSGLECHHAAWEELARRALEPNIFQEPWFVLPALAAFGSARPPRFVFLYLEDGALAGVFPLERVERYRQLPLRHYRLWTHDHCFLGTPLVRADLARQCLEAFLEWVRRDDGGLFMSWHLVSSDGPFFRTLEEILGARRLPSFSHFSLERAILRPRGDADAYLREALSSRALKDLRRRERRLLEYGAVEYRSLNGSGEVARWVDDFLEVEASGWKGQAGTAMKLDPRTREFFRSIAEGAARRGRLQMHSLVLDGKPIAVQCDFVAGEGAFSYKVAYDERHASCSPGVLLEVENIRRAHRNGHPRWVDSCMLQHDGAPNRMWLDRRRVIEFITAVGKPQGNAAVAMLPLLRSAWRLIPRRSSPAVFLPPSLEELGLSAEPLVAALRFAS